MARYRIIHDTEYRYAAPVSLSRQLLHLTPRTLSWQRCLDHHLEILPAFARRLERCDVFGNPVTLLALEAPHEILRVRAESTVDVLGQQLPDKQEIPNWEAVRALLNYHPGVPLNARDLDAARYRFESPYGRVKHDFAAYAADCFLPGISVLDGVRALTAKIFHEFAFDPEATTVATPVTQVFEARRGVCQDFSHLMISCLRSLGLAARYVSGYILTTPPAGQTRLIGADASHAWVSVWCPIAGEDRWIDTDPTNNLLPGSQHVTLAWGRDFTDVSPLRGVILGGGTHELKVNVTMLPLDELELSQT